MLIIERYLAENIEKPGAWELLQDFFPPESADAILGQLGLQAPLEETSGAGGGGFILFYCEKKYQKKLRIALSDLKELDFCFESEGSKIVFKGE